MLAENGVASDAFEMQFAVYRNYNSPEELLLQRSHWETDPQRLRRFLEAVAVQVPPPPLALPLPASLPACLLPYHCPALPLPLSIADL